MKNRDISRLYSLPNQVVHNFFLLKNNEQFQKEVLKFNFNLKIFTLVHSKYFLTLDPE